MILTRECELLTKYLPSLYSVLNNESIKKVNHL